MRAHSTVTLALFLLLLPAGVIGHTPSVLETDTDGPEAAVVLEDPTLSRAIGATLEQPGEVDWYRLDLRAGDLIVLGMTAPDAEGAVAATFTLIGPGLPPAAEAGPLVERLAVAAGADGAVVFEPLDEPRREVHAGLGFLNYGDIRLEAPVDGSYLVAVQAADGDATGKYVFAPGLREEFGLESIGGMVDLIGFFEAPWPVEGS